jgi:hypothetical protein
MNGIDLIVKERDEQIHKHGYTVLGDVENNNESQLIFAAANLVEDYPEEFKTMFEEDSPPGWKKEVWIRLINKPYKERLVIAGALIAAEIDRIS